jgi:hypothetical protein
VGFETRTHQATTNDNYMNELTKYHYHPHALCCVLAIWLFLWVGQNAGRKGEKALLQILVRRWIVRFANVPFERWILKLNI